MPDIAFIIVVLLNKIKTEKIIYNILVLELSHRSHTNIDKSVDVHSF